MVHPWDTYNGNRVVRTRQCCCQPANMDSLLYLGAGNNDDDDDDDDEDEEEEDEEAEAASGGSSSAGASKLDFQALQRAGYNSATSLTQTATYKRLEIEEDEVREEVAASKKRVADAEFARLQAEDQMKVGCPAPCFQNGRFHRLRLCEVS